MAGEALDVFISYSRRDEGLKDELVNYHLKLLQREGKINTWQDRDIEAGTEWAAEIKTNLEKADIVLLLITRHFLASDYCYETEMQRAVQRHHDGTAKVIPIILETCGWQYSDFSHLQVLPKDGKPVTRWDDKAEAFFDVEEGIRRVVDYLNAERQQEAAQTQVESERQRQQAVERRRQEQLAAERQRQLKAAALRRQQLKTGINRRQAFKIFGLAGGSLALGLGGHSLLRSTRGNPTSPADLSPFEVEVGTTIAPANLSSEVDTTIAPANLSSFEFEVITVNETGEVADRQIKQAEEYQEDLDNGVTLNMVAIPAGEFVMGSSTEEGGRFDNEGPQRTVTVPSFFMGRFQVTQTQYQAVMGANPSRFQGVNRPVERVSWDDAVAFCEKLSELTGRTYRLPSEAEWEYACRAGTTTPFHFGQIITTDLVNYDGNYTYGAEPKEKYREQTTDVGSFPTNAFGLYDMHGNVWDWCQDVWHENYEGAPTDGSAWMEGGDQTWRLPRGGSWDSSSVVCRSAYRHRYAPDLTYFYVGLRVVCGSA